MYMGLPSEIMFVINKYIFPITKPYVRDFVQPRAPGPPITYCKLINPFMSHWFHFDMPHIHIEIQYITSSIQHTLAILEIKKQNDAISPIPKYLLKFRIICLNCRRISYILIRFDYFIYFMDQFSMAKYIMNSTLWFW